MKHLIVLFLSLLLWAAPAAAQDQEFHSVPVDFQAMASQTGESVNLFALPGRGTFDPAQADYGHQLSSDPVAQLAYRSLVEDLAPGVNAVYFDLDSLNAGPLDWETDVIPGMQAAVAAYVFDHPESQYCTITNINLQGSMASFTVVQRADASRRLSALNKAIDRFVDSFDDTADPAEQYRAIHDYICSLTSYDDEAAKENVFSEAHTAFGVLVDGRDVVCEGYSKAFKVLCDAVDLPCLLVAGSSFDPADPNLEKVNHMWNYVRVDGAWYAVDVTWDDYYDEYMLTSELDLTVTLPTYTYFLNNNYFHSQSETRDHSPTGNIYFVSDWPMSFGLPELTEGQHPSVVGLLPDELTVTLYSDTLTIPERLWNFSVDGVALSSVPKVTLALTQNATVSGTLSVPAEKTYTIDSAGTDTYTIRHASSFESPLFAVEGDLVLADVEVDNDGQILPLLTLAASGSFRDTADPQLESYLNYSGKETGSAIGYQASYDARGRMLGLTQMGTFRLTAPAIYSFGVRPDVPETAETVKQFLIGPNTMAPVSRCITNP